MGRRFYLALASAALAFPAYAQQGAGSQQPPTSPPQSLPSSTQGQTTQAQAEADTETRQFVEKAAASDMYEIQSSKLALDKVGNDSVKKFAQRIIDDHTKSSNELKSVVQNIRGVQVPEKLDQRHQKLIDQLSSASDQSFAQLYRTQQIDAHKEAVQLFEWYSKNGRNPTLKGFAEKTLAALKDHHQMAQDMPRGTGPQVGQAPSTGMKQDDNNQRQSAAQRQAILSRLTSDHILGSNLQGTTVYGANDEEIGEVDDLVVDRNGEVVAVVVGVGGFLGIGEKNVAIPFDALEINPPQTTGTARGNREGDQRNTGAGGSTDPDRIVLRGMTKQDLQDAPSFEVFEAGENR